MQVLEVKVFEKRNIYAHKKCIRVDLDLEGYSEIPSKDIKEFNETLLKLVPELSTHHCGIYEEGGFVKRLYEGTYLAHICEHMIIAFQNRLGIEAAYGKAREISGERYYIVFQYEYKNTALEATNIAVDLINALIRQREFNFNERMNLLKDILSREQLGPSTIAICNEANKRGIPIARIGERSLFQLGYGKYGKMIEATICDETSTVGVDISCDKLLTKELLNIQCIPVARGGKVLNSLDLLLKAESIGYPIVIKPRYGNQGRSVFVNIKNEKEALKIYESMSKDFKDIIVEKYIKGSDYRVCVVNNQVVACAERKAPYVVGDGYRNIRALIRELNDDVRRGEGHEKPLTKVKIDDELINCIARQGYSINSIVEKNIKVTLRENANLSTGGSAIDCTEIINKENIEICRRVAKTIGLNICGIDICCQDISKPLEGQGVVIEVNAAPGIRMHHYPYMGKERNVAKAIVDMMFGENYKSIPIVSVTGTNGKTTTTRLIAHTLGLTGYNVGMTSTGGIYIGNNCIDKGDTTGPDSAVTVLLNKDVEAAVLETARGGIVRRGLAYDLADVGVITNITEDHLGIDGINTLEELAKVKALVVEAVKLDGYAVLNADDAVSASIIDRIKCNLILFSMNKDNKLLEENLKRGGYVIYSSNGYIYMQKGETVTPIIKEEDIAVTLKGKLRYNIANAMAACAALVAMKVDYNIIKKGLNTFCSNEEHNPGRFNMYNVNDVKVILDYGHNIEGYKAVLDAMKDMEHKSLIGIIGVPGDRLNSNIIEVGKISGNYLDSIYIKEDMDKRGRKNGEVAELLEQGIKASRMNPNNYRVILDEKEALNRAIDDAKPGDVIIVFFEKHEPLLKLVKEKIEQGIDRVIEVEGNTAEQ